MTTDAPVGLSGIVLCGGYSRRMGRNKALMALQGQRLIARVLQRLAPLCDELIIAANDADVYTELPARVVADILPVPGPLSGIHAGLTSMRNELGIVVACDMPFLNRELLRFMAVVAPGHDVVVPRWQGEYEPLHAVYRATCVRPIERLLAEGPRRVVALLPLVRVREITEAEIALFDAELSFFNINTPEDWAEAQRLSRRR